MRLLQPGSYRRWPIAGTLGWSLIAIGVTACSSSNVRDRYPVEPHLQQLPTVTLDPAQALVGQSIYVPSYSHIYHYNRQGQTIDLATTLSIRNTDSEQAIILTSVRYYDTNGQLIREYAESPVELAPLASTDVFIQTDDRSGGSGANFILEWVATAPVYEPVVEAVIVSTASSQGISWLSQGRVRQQWGEFKSSTRPLANP